mmetsp:Transcript_87752/g.232967  ORF Transcript_87752/g.232967 Transcript_87752/m.232967 type:complete len:215 (-) Transcript_87752:80-724(-)
MPLVGTTTAEVLDTTDLAQVLSGELSGVLLLQIIYLLVQGDRLLHLHLAHGERRLGHALRGLDELCVTRLHLLAPLLRVRRHAHHLAANAPGAALGPLAGNVGIAVTRDNLKVVEEVFLVLCSVPPYLRMSLELLAHHLGVDLIARPQLPLCSGEPIVRAEADKEELADTPVRKVRLAAGCCNLGISVGAHEGIKQRPCLLHLLLSEIWARSMA